MSAWRKILGMKDGLPPDPDYRPAHRNPERLFLKDVFNTDWCSSEFSKITDIRAVVCLIFILAVQGVIIALTRGMETYVIIWLTLGSVFGFILPLGSRLFLRSLASSGDGIHSSFLNACGALPVRPVAIKRAVFLQGLVFAYAIVLFSFVSKILWFLNHPPSSPLILHLWVVPLSALLASLVFPWLIASLHASLAAGDRVSASFCAMGAITIFPLLRNVETFFASHKTSPLVLELIIAALILALVAVVAVKHLRTNSRRPA